MAPRSFRSWACANIILYNGLFNDFKVWRYKHPKIKSAYRAGNLFLLHRGLRWSYVPNPVMVNMDSIEDYYYE